MPFTAASETTRSAFFRVSLVASTGPDCRRAVDEIDLAAPTPRAGVVRIAGVDATRAVRGVKRVRKDMVDVAMEKMFN